MTDLLADKVALVTGAGSAEGMGAATARCLAAQGATVVVTDLPGPAGEVPTELAGTADAIVLAGGRALALILDVTDQASVQRAVDQSVAQFGGIDILFANAGIGRTGAFLEVPDADWDLLYRVNQLGMVRVCRAVIPSMLGRGGGAIVLNSSMSGLSGIAQYAAYTMTKFAVVGLMKVLADEFGEQGIRCNAVCPGNIATAMGRREIAERARHLDTSIAAATAELASECALRRLGTAEEVAQAVTFLAGPGAAFVSGVAMPVAGGMYQGI